MALSLTQEVFFILPADVYLDVGAGPPELEPFIVVGNVQLTGITLGAGAYGSVEEVEIPGARVAAKKLHSELINLSSPQQVANYPP